MDDKFCTVLDKLDSKAVLFVTKNCLSTVVGNPQRKVTVFVPAKGFTDTTHFKAHVCGGAWDLKKLQEYAETDAAFLVSKGGADDNKRFKYPVVLKGKKITVGGVELKKEPLVTRNGVIYNLADGESLVGEVDTREFVPREKGVRRKSSKRNTEGGGDRIVNDVAIFRDLIGYELRERIIDAYTSLYPVSSYPIVTGGMSAVGATPICWPNVLWSDFSNYVVSEPTLGFGYLQGLSPLISNDYWSNIQMVFQPTDTDLTTYGVADEILRNFALSNFFAYDNPAVSINTAFDFHNRLNLVISRGGAKGGKITFGGVLGSILMKNDPIDVESGFGKIEESLAEYTKFSNDVIKSLAHDPYAKYIITCVCDAVYGEQENSDFSGRPYNDVYLGSRSNHGKHYALLNKLTSGSSTVDLRTLFNTSAGVNDPVERYANLLIVMSLARYLNRDKKNDRFSCLPLYLQCNGYTSSLGQYTFRGIIGSKNFRVVSSDVYTDANRPRKNYLVTNVFLDTSFVFVPIVGLLPEFNTYYMLMPEHKNCFTMCMFKLFKELWISFNETDEIFTHPKFYTLCRNEPAIATAFYPFFYLIAPSKPALYGIRADEYFGKYVPRQFYDYFAKFCWDRMDTITNGAYVIDTISVIILEFIFEIFTDYFDYEAKQKVKSNSPMWFLRIPQGLRNSTSFGSSRASSISTGGVAAFGDDADTDYSLAQQNNPSRPRAYYREQANDYEQENVEVKNKRKDYKETIQWLYPKLKEIYDKPEARNIARKMARVRVYNETKVDEEYSDDEIFESPELFARYYPEIHAYAVAQQEKQHEFGLPNGGPPPTLGTAFNSPMDPIALFRDLVKHIHEIIHDYNIPHCLFRPTNVLDYLHNNGFSQMVNAIRAFEGPSALPAIGSIRHDHSPGFLYEPEEYNTVKNSARATFNQLFYSNLNKTFAGGAEKVIDIYEAAHNNNSMFFMNNYMTIKPFHPKVSTTMFYSDFMKFVGAKQVGGNSYAVMGDIYKNMFPGNIAMAVKNLTNPKVYPDLDFGVIDAFVRSDYFLCNTGNMMFRAPRALTDDKNPTDDITSNLLA